MQNYDEPLKIDSSFASDGHEFEYFCADLLRKNGFNNVVVTPGSGDQGVDILAEKDFIKYAFQCKMYSSPLGNTPVQEVHAGKAFYNCHVGVVLTNSTFTPSAIELAKSTGVLLWDKNYLKKLLSVTDNDFSSGAASVESAISNADLYRSPNIRKMNIPVAILQQIDDCNRRGDRIQAIKLYREYANNSLKEAKDFIEQNWSWNKNNSSGCYIATAVYGSYNCPEVYLLRRFRDYSLSTSFFGRAFIKVYYKISPYLVLRFGSTTIFTSFFKLLLDSIVDKLRRRGYSDSPYHDKT